MVLYTSIIRNYQNTVGREFFDNFRAGAGLKDISRDRLPEVARPLIDNILLTALRSI